jgi:hypothetical protein
MTLISNLHTSLLLLLFVAFTAQLKAQIKGSVTDEKYGNTTVIYKDSNANDAQVLAQLEASMGMGDVVRITLAPPKPQVKAADKLSSPKPVVAPSAKAPTFISGTDVRATESIPVPKAVVIKVDTQHSRPVTASTERVAAAPVQVAVVQEKNAVVPQGGKNVTIGKTNSGKTLHSATKSSKTGKLYKHKRKKSLSFRLFDKPIFKKKSKSKYGCYKF